MKYMLPLFLTILLSSSSSLYAENYKRTAPESDYSLDGAAAEENYRNYEKDKKNDIQTDTTRTGQSALDRKYKKEEDKLKKTCKHKDGSWLRRGETGYASCVMSRNLEKDEP